ncbi:phage holin family protein [Hyalangium rubrum]|uniref:Phage holin family protein n=1 Tax=Hyalangium rubrum TaxID=3103134 RepID=A0ABU5GZ78_9BACT|nr:phage holin family protein [Hyalangium sp. s54d21]MDY7225145.1 phage holin family protein [Hyalangium sp. s54d21]
MNLGTEQTDRGISAIVGRMADGFSRLVSQHITLARMELAEDAKAMGLDVARIAVFVPFLLVGYFFMCGALSVALAPWLGYAGGLALVGALNLVGGIVGILTALSRIKARQVMNDSAEELSRSMAALTTPNAIAAPPQPRNVLKEPPHAQ